jgi:RNA methyltransferase, RsmE family
MDSASKYLFYAPEINVVPTLSPEESLHCARVLRLKQGDEIVLTDGIGYFYKATLESVSSKCCHVRVFEKKEQKLHWENCIEIAVAPTKNADRMEWLVEKATEIGINRFHFLRCRFSERKEIRLQRIEKSVIAAAKQSFKATLPQLNEMVDFKKFVKQDFSGRKFIAHCHSGEKKILSRACKKGENALILIGPEGDFSETEVNLAIENGFEPISLGETRLRTETAALMACHTVHLINQL